MASRSHSATDIITLATSLPVGVLVSTPRSMATTDHLRAAASFKMPEKSCTLRLRRSSLATTIPLSRLVRPGSVEENLLQQMPLELRDALAEGMDGVAAGRRYLNIVQREVFDGIRAKLVECTDYKGEVIPVVDEVLLLILNFVVSRTAADSGHYPYLFDEASKEIEIHEDLYNYLVGNLGARAEYEVSHVGGGRVDLRLKFDRFAIHIEMKVDSTQVSMDDKTAYLKQAASYQGNDIRVGFLIALRHKAFKKGGSAAHLRSLVGHTTFEIQGDSEPRHIVTVAVPGSRTKPSASTAN